MASRVRGFGAAPAAAAPARASPGTVNRAGRRSSSAQARPRFRGWALLRAGLTTTPPAADRYDRYDRNRRLGRNHRNRRHDRNRHPARPVPVLSPSPSSSPSSSNLATAPRTRQPPREPGQSRVLLSQRRRSLPHRVLEVEAELSERAGQPGFVGSGEQPRQVEYQGGRQGRVTALPDGLENHAGAEEPVEGDVVPRGLPVAERGHVVDVDLALGGGGEGVGEDAFLAGVLRRGGCRVGQGGAVASTEQIGAGPGANREGPLGEHRAEDGTQQRLACLAVASRVRQAARCRRVRQSGVVQTGRRGEVGVRAARAQGRRRIEGAGREGRARGRGLGGGHVHHHGTRQAASPYEVGHVRGEGGDQFLFAPCVAGGRSARSDLPVGGGQFGRHCRGEADGKDTACRECLRAFGQGAVQGVVSAEDEGGERRQSGSCEDGCLGDQAGGRLQARGQAAQPATTVVATEPRAPISQTPTRGVEPESESET